MTTARKRRRVALLVETSEERGRAIVRGVVRYANLYGLWDFHITPGDEKQRVSSLRDWRGDGIVARVSDDALAEAILETKLPFILLGHSTTQPTAFARRGPFYTICMENEKIGRTAAENLLKKGFETFGFYTPNADSPWSRERELGFRARLKEEGVSEEQIHSLRGKKRRTGSVLSPTLRRELTNLPKPIAILAATDRDGLRLLECCAAASIDVPRDAIVLGVDDDELLCVSGSPPLSSVSVDAKGAGFRAAAVLDRMMNAPNDPTLVPGVIPIEPTSVVERQSTNSDYFSDRLVADAFEYLRANINFPINVSDIVRAVKKSRRVVETRFKSATGETLHEALLRLKLDATKRFLTETNLTLRQIAESVGFNDDGYMNRVFKKKFNATMDAYRRRYRREIES